MPSSERGHLNVASRRDLTLNLSWGECIRAAHELSGVRPAAVISQLTAISVGACPGFRDGRGLKSAHRVHRRRSARWIRRSGVHTGSRPRDPQRDRSMSASSPLRCRADQPCPGTQGRRPERAHQQASRLEGALFLHGQALAPDLEQRPIRRERRRADEGADRDRAPFLPTHAETQRAVSHSGRHGDLGHAQTEAVFQAFDEISPAQCPSEAAIELLPPSPASRHDGHEARDTHHPCVVLAPPLAAVCAMVWLGREASLLVHTQSDPVWRPPGVLLHPQRGRDGRPVGAHAEGEPRPVALERSAED